MKKALIFNGNLVQVELTAFPVSPEMSWIDVADDVTTQTHEYNGKTVVLIPKASLVFPPLSPAQIRLVLNQYGLLAKVETAIAAGDIKLQIEWHQRLSFERGNVTLNAMAKSLGITDEQVDEMFTIGATL